MDFVNQIYSTKPSNKTLETDYCEQLLMWVVLFCIFWTEFYMIDREPR